MGSGMEGLGGGYGVSGCDEVAQRDSLKNIIFHIFYYLNGMMSLKQGCVKDGYL